MMLYSFQGSRPAPLPFRITLPNGFTRTDPSTFTEDEIRAAGFTGPYVEPPYNPATEQLSWVDGAFTVDPLPPALSKPEVINLDVTAAGILNAAATGDVTALATLLNDLITAAKAM
jgi:hypothetical protein